MKVAHIVNGLSGTSIPVDIATALDSISGVDSRIVSLRRIKDIPGTTDSDIVLRSLSPVERNSELLRKLSNRGYDIIHTHHNSTAAKLSIYNFFTDLAHVNTQHGHIHYTVPQKILNSITILNVDKLVYNSQTTMDSYNKLEKKIKNTTPESVCHNGVNTSLLDNHRAEAAGSKTVITAARLIPRKNIRCLIKAVTRINVDLHIIGDGPEKSKLSDLAQQMGISDRVTFFGYLPDRESVYEKMADAGIFVIPSHSEGFGVALAEAMAIGLPVVASDIDIFHEVGGDTIRYVDQNSPEEIAKQIKSLLEDNKKSETLGRAARKRIYENFRISQTADCYASVYDTIMHS
jgi:glycosyltransferase involved in cell wall biosynthesis